MHFIISQKINENVNTKPTTSGYIGNAITHLSIRVSRDHVRYYGVPTIAIGKHIRAKKRQ